MNHDPYAKEELKVLSGLTILIKTVETSTKDKEKDLLKISLYTIWNTLKNDQFNCMWYVSVKLNDLLYHAKASKCYLSCYSQYGLS